MTGWRTTFTRHAYDRADERSSMTLDEIAELLDSKFSVIINSEKGTNRAHHLYYSVKDNKYFVAVRDEKKLEVVTLLTVLYYEQLNSVIPIPFLKQARALVDPEALAAMQAQKAKPPVNNATSFKVSGGYINDLGQPFLANLGTFPGTPYDLSMEKMVKDEEFLQEVHSRFKKKVPTYDMFELYIKLGKKGECIRFPIQKRTNK